MNRRLVSAGRLLGSKGRLESRDFGHMARGRSSGDVEIRSCGGEEEKYVSLASLEFWAFMHFIPFSVSSLCLPFLAFAFLLSALYQAEAVDE